MSARIPIVLDRTLADEIVRLAVEAQEQIDKGIDLRLVVANVKARLLDKLGAAAELSSDYKTKFACFLPTVFLGSIISLYYGKDEAWFQLYKDNVSRFKQALRAYLKGLAEGYKNFDFDHVVMETATFYNDASELAEEITKT